MKIDLTGKVAIVTGSTGELGRVMVRTLAQCGADVVVHYLQNRAKADELTAEIRKMGRKTVAVQADVTKEEDVKRLHAEVAAALREPDIIVNNAVKRYDWKPLLEQPLEDYEGQLRSSIMHNVLMCKQFVPGMIQRKWGRVIAINTECAMHCGKNQSAYVAGKRGMDGVLRALAREVGEHGITVNQVAPGWTISDRDRAAGTFRQPEYEKIVALGHRGTDQDIANGVAFLASDLASFITGCYLPVNGGSAMPTI